SRSSPPSRSGAHLTAENWRRTFARTAGATAFDSANGVGVDGAGNIVVGESRQIPTSAPAVWAVPRLTATTNEQQGGGPDRPWTADDIPSQAGKTFVITGANSGIGYEAALQLAGKGAHVVLACRDQGKGHAAAAAITAAHPSSSVEVMELDLAALGSIRRLADAGRPPRPGLHDLGT